MQTTNSHGPQRSSTEPSEHLALLGKPPLFEGEEQTYKTLLTEIFKAVNPAGICEEIWAHDYAYRTIEIFRLRRVEVNLIRVTEYKGLQVALTPIVGGPQAEALAQGWAARKPDVMKEAKKILRSAGLSTDTILAQAFSLKLNDIERIKHMLALAEARRDATLWGIDRHRKTLGQQLRRVAQRLEHDQFRALESAPMSVDGSEEK
jgi:hypothetical protein